MAARPRIRRAIADDIRALSAIETVFPLADRISVRQLRYHMRHPRNRLFVATLDNTPCAYLLLFVRRKSARIYSLAVDPACRGQGLGESLCRHAEEYAQRLGLARISLEVRERNSAALALYSKLGYAVTRRLPAYYPDGSDGLKAVKFLSPPSPKKKSTAQRRQ